QEAQQLGCDAAAGPAALFERDDLDAVLLADVPWFGLWPLELAARFGRPVYCGLPLALDDAQADAVHQRVRAAPLPVMVEMRPRVAPVSARLREVLQSDLGPAQLLIGQLAYPPQMAPSAAAVFHPQVSSSLFGPCGISVLDWCALLFDAAPTSVTVTR